MIRHEIIRGIDTYSFNVKLYKVYADISEDDWEFEVRAEIEFFKIKLKERFRNIGDLYLAGRSGGWLAIERTNGPFRSDTLAKISELVNTGLNEFKYRIEQDYPQCSSQS